MLRIRAGGVLLIVGVVWFFVLQVVAAQAWPPPGYNWRRNAISDLGNTACGPFAFHGPTVWVCSPRHALANAGLVIVGLVLVGGFWLIRPMWGPSGALFGLGTGLMMAAGLGSATVGLVPENVHPRAHVIAAQSVPLLGVATAALAVATLRSPTGRGRAARPAVVLGRSGIGAAVAAFAGGLWSACAEVYGAAAAWRLGAGGAGATGHLPGHLVDHGGGAGGDNPPGRNTGPSRTEIRVGRRRPVGAVDRPVNVSA